MISSVSTFDAPRAYEVAQRLPAITIPDDVDVDALEMGKYKRCVVGVRQGLSQCGLLGLCDPTQAFSGTTRNVTMFSDRVLSSGVGVTSGRGLRKVIKPDEEKIKEANRK